MNFTAYDLLGIAIIAVPAIIGYAKGAINTLISLVSVIASFIIARIFAPIAASWIVGTNAVQQSINATVSSSMQSAIEGYSADVSSNLPNLPGMDSVGGLISNAINSAGQSGIDGAASAVSASVTPVLSSVIEIVAFMIIFLLCSLVFSIIRNLSRKLNDVPVLGFLNRLAGLGLGVVIGLIVTWSLLFVMYSVASLGDSTMAETLQNGVLTGPLVLAMG